MPALQSTPLRFFHILLCLLSTPALADSAADLAIRDLQRTYQSAPTCERIGIEVRTPGPVPGTPQRVARSSFIVRVQPGENPGEVAALALDLGQLRIWADTADRSLAVAHSRDASTFFQSDLAPPLTSAALARVLPPVLIPQLDLASSNSVSTSLWPYATEITWNSVEQDANAPSRRTIRGTFSSGSVTITTSAARLRTLTIDLPAKSTSITLNCSPVGPCDVHKAAIDPARRTRVDSVEDLKPRAGTLRVGVRVPEMPLTRAGSGSTKWSLGDLLAPPEEALRTNPTTPAAEHAVLVLQRVLPQGTASALARFSTDRLAELLIPMRRASFLPKTGPEAERDPAALLARFGLAPVLVMSGPTPPAPDDILRRLREADEKWGGRTGERSQVEILWSTEASATIDLFAPGAEAVIVILDADSVLRAVITIDPQATTDQVADQIAAALFELAPADQPTPQK